MDYSLTFRDQDYDALCRHLFEGATTERGAYVLCKLSRTSVETRLLARVVLDVASEDIVDSSKDHLSIHSRSYLRAMKMAVDREEAFVFVHSHPGGFPRHSEQDDAEEAALFRTAYTRIHGDAIHGSLVLSAPDRPVGRVWLADGSIHQMKRIRVVGSRFRIFQESLRDTLVASYLDRQVRAFGADIQRVLSHLTVGIVGSGGTGSAVFEQLVRLGVGRLLVADPERFESSNVNRVYGSCLSDDGVSKVAIAERSAGRIGLGTCVTTIPKSITFASVLKEFRNCDVVFGCTDDQWGRSLLTRLAVFYCIPVFDMGVQIDSEDGLIETVQGRVTTLFPSRACLFCRQRISPDAVAAETLQALNPSAAERLRQEGYAPELATPAPAVVPFTTAVAASAIAEFLHRLTGFLGGERQTSEVVHLFSDTRVRTNDRPPSPECFCGQPQYWGIGDMAPFLDVTWRPE
ncbi:MAG: ThiF family adenylyltransferase [Gemmatimonadaceae bacterium]